MSSIEVETSEHLMRFKENKFTNYRCFTVYLKIKVPSGFLICKLYFTNVFTSEFCKIDIQTIEFRLEFFSCTY